MPRKAVIFADGEPCPPRLRIALSRGRLRIVLDGAAERARREGWVPEVVLGDFDSVRPATLRYFAKRGTRIVPAPDQDHTDLEKALAWCQAEGIREVAVAQALGLRTDHSFANLALLKRFHPCLRLTLHRPGESVRFVRDARLRLRGPAGRLVAVLPFPHCRVNSRGLAYEMRATRLRLGQRESVANRARGTTVWLGIEGEALVVEGNERE